MKERSIKLLTLTIVCFILLNSCLSLLGLGTEGEAQGSSSASSAAPQNWGFGEFTNEWGDKSGEYFMLYKGKITGVFSNSVANNASLIVEQFIFSDKYLSMDLLQYGDKNTLLAMGTRADVNVTMRTKSLGDKTFSGGNSSSSAKTIVVDFSDELLKVLELQEETEFRITISNRTVGTSTYQFKVKFDDFNAAHERMKTIGKK